MGELTKCLFKALEGGAGSCTAMFNPKELQIDKSVSWSPAGAHDENPTQEFKEPQSSTLAVTLYFDTYETKADVSGLVKPLELMATMDKGLGRPPLCLFTWGTGIKFQGVFESVSQKYTMFLSNGKPVRAEVSVKMKSANKAEVATKK